MILKLFIFKTLLATIFEVLTILFNPRADIL